MKKLLICVVLMFFFSISYAQTIMTHNSSQEITDQVSKLCQSYEISDIPWDSFCEGIWDDNNHSCPATSFIAQTTGNYVITITDVFGDGWNNTTLTVNVNNQPVLSDIGQDFDRFWEKEFIFSANQGDEISAYWSNIGPWFNQCGYRIASEEAINSVIFPSNTYSQIYYRQFIPYDFGFSGSLNLTEIQFGVWYTDTNGNPNPNLPDVTVQANIKINNVGGVGGEMGLNTSTLSQIEARTADIVISAGDHQSIVTGIIEFDGLGNTLTNGYEADANTEYVVELIFPSGTQSPLSPALRLSTGGNFSDYTLVTSNQSLAPSTQSNSTNCEAFVTYMPDNSSLINLVTSNSPEIPFNDIIFNVDMSDTVVEPEGVFLGGGLFQIATAYQMFDPDGDNIYSVSVPLMDGTSGNYTFINGPSWRGDFEGKEQLAGQDCADPENFIQRYFDPISGPTTFTFCFGECSSECPQLPPPAPTPTASAGDVISIYSDYYDVGVDNLNMNPFWFQQTVFSEVIVAEGDSVMHLENLNYQGHTFSPVDISEMTHLHYDYLSFNSEDGFGDLRLTLINTNANVPGGVVEDYISTNVSATGQWIQVDTPITDYNNLIDHLNGINQMRWNTDTEGGSIYIDNLYFYTNNTASIGDNILNSLKIYPNPTSDYLFTDGDNNYNLKIYNHLGQLLLQANDTKMIDVSALSKGAYLVNISNGTNSITKKFIKD